MLNVTVYPKVAPICVKMKFLGRGDIAFNQLLVERLFYMPFPELMTAVDFNSKLR